MNYQDEGTLYILGNGFDRCHELHTDTKDFLSILRTKDIYNETETAENIFRKYNVLWGDYEKCLADIDLESISEDNIIQPDYLSDHEYDRDGGILNMEMYTESLRFALKESLEEMVDNANTDLINKKPVLLNFLKPSDAVVSFNYTSTLEKLYNIPKGVHICHIHGFRAKGEPLLLGYTYGISEEEYNDIFFDTSELELILEKIKDIENDEMSSQAEKEEELNYWNICYTNLTDNRDFYIDMQRDVVFQFYRSLKKEVQIEKLTHFINKCKNIKHIVVMGHSMSDVDTEYMELIEEKLSPIKWNISQHNNSPSLIDINRYSFSNKVEFYNLYEIYKR